MIRLNFDVRFELILLIKTIIGMRLTLTILLCSFFLATEAQVKSIIHVPELEKMLTPKSDSVVVINFWATWCAPCVKELPLFEKLHQEKPEIKVTLINLDFADKIDKVNSFIARKKLVSDVYLLDDVDYNSWINKVDKSWGGAIPATLIINTKTGQRKFVERELQPGELEVLIANTY